jgi:hypothetical protein
MQNEIELRQQQEIINRGRKLSRLNGVSCDIGTQFIFTGAIYMYIFFSN